MGLFSRRDRQKSDVGVAADGPLYIGRKFDCHESLDICLETYEQALAQCFDVSGRRFEAGWVEPDAAGFESNQGQTPGRPPDRVVGHPLATGGNAYLAMWDNGERMNQLWFVPPGFDTDDVGPIGGTWFTILRSAGHSTVGSVGFVERPLWGVVE